MRMRKKPNVGPRMEACDPVWIREPAALKGSWRSLMPEAKELRVEVGCGKGKFTVETAAAEPDVLIIAIERVREALVMAMEKAMAAELKNVYFVSMDVAQIEEFFAPGEIDLLYINFCDPWPRSKNAKRRLTYHTFLEKYKPGQRAVPSQCPAGNRRREHRAEDHCGPAGLRSGGAQRHRRSARERSRGHHDRL